MTGEPGQNSGASTTTLQYNDASETTTAGDAVGITGGEIEPGTDTENLLGVRARGRLTPNGSEAPVITSGPTIAAVEGSVAAGENLDLGRSRNR